MNITKLNELLKPFTENQEDIITKIIQNADNIFAMSINDTFYYIQSVNEDLIDEEDALVYAFQIDDEYNLTGVVKQINFIGSDFRNKKVRLYSLKEI
jgi:hypothetical protein